MDQAETLPKSMDLEKFDPVSEYGIENVLDPLDRTLDPLDTHPTKSGSNFAVTLTESIDPLDPSLDPYLIRT